MRGLIEYVTVTGNKDDYLDCVGQMSQRTYRNVEWLDSSRIDSPPEIGDIGLLIEIHNNEYVFIGRLKQYKGTENPGELRIFGNNSVGMVIKQAGAGYSLELYKADIVKGTLTSTPIYTPTTSIKITETGQVHIDSSGEVTITGASINLNGSSKGVARENDDVLVEGTTGVGYGPDSHTHSVNITAKITTASNSLKTS